MSTQSPIDPEQIRSAVANTLREHSTFFLVEGIVLLILGALAILLPPIATLAVTIILGWIFLVSGMIGWMTTFGAGLVMMSLFVGEFARTGWLAYPPLSGT